MPLCNATEGSYTSQHRSAPLRTSSPADPTSPNMNSSAAPCEQNKSDSRTPRHVASEFTPFPVLAVLRLRSDLVGLLGRRRRAGWRERMDGMKCMGIVVHESSTSIHTMATSTAAIARRGMNMATMTSSMKAR